MGNGTEPISNIVVMADGVCTYAWNGAGECLGRGGLKMIAQSLLEHPSLSDLVDLEYEFWDWAGKVPSVSALDSTQWREFHLCGLMLARRLADLMRCLEIPVFYRSAQRSTHQHLDIGPL